MKMERDVARLAKYLFLASLICLCMFYLIGAPYSGVVSSPDPANSGAYVPTEVLPTKILTEVLPTEILTEVPTRGGSLTRLGSQLHFDYGTCPNSSLMTNKSAKRVALHDDCPQVFILGIRKGGTTSLIKYLSEHPDFTGANINDTKRPYHSGGTEYFSRLYDSWSWQQYKAMFVGNGMVLGESSVENLVDCLVPSRIYKYCGESMKSMKFIMLLRDPVERFQSNFRFRMRIGFPGYTSKSRINMSLFVTREVKDFYDTTSKKGIDIDKVENHLNDLLCLYKPAKSVIFEGLYLVHLHHWLCNAPARNILILNSEEFYNNPADIVAEVIRFVGLSPLSNENIASIVSRGYNTDPPIKLEVSKHLLSKMERQQIKDIYKPFNSKLLDLLQWPHNLWS